MEPALRLGPAAPPIAPIPPSAPTPERAGAAWLTHRATWHAAFWAVHALNELLIAVVERRTLGSAATRVLVVYSVLAVPAYVNLFVFVPRLWRRSRRVLSSVAASLFAAATAGVFIAARQSFAWDGSFLRAELRWTCTCVLYILSVAGVDMAARHMREMRDRAERERREAEQRLEHLRAQLNPHFLFNTLNSLYALAIVQSPELPGLIVQHAELLRYALDHTRHARVPLTSEIDFVAAYVAAERLRVAAGTDVRIAVDGVVHDQQIAPMLFAPLVENCFKHLGGATSRFVDILIRVEPSRVCLQLRNTRDDIAAPREGIGLRNTRERLALLYPSRHVLETKLDGGLFEALLTVEL